jgi:integrase
MKTLTLPTQQKGFEMLSLGLPDEREVSAPQFHQFIDLFVEMKARKLTPGTITEYRVALSPFIEWWLDNSDHYNHMLSLSLFEDFFEWYTMSYCSPKLKSGATINMCHKTSALLRRVLRWAHRRGAITEDVSELVPAHSYEPAPPYFPTLDEINRLFLAPYGRDRIRDAAILAFMASTGCRREEVNNIHAEDVHFMGEGRSLNPDHDHTGYVFFRVSKRKKIGRVAVFDTVGGLLIRLWMQYSGIREGPLFTIGNQTIYIMVVHHSQRAGITRIHPHNLRHAFNDSWLEVNSSGGDMADVARRMQLGHAIDRNDVNLYHYSNWRFNPDQPERAVERILQFHTSPLLRLHQSNKWDWSLWPVII